MNHELAEVTLKSGTKGLLIDVPGSKVVNLRLVFRGGFQFADRSKFEAPHLIEHHILNATKRYPKKNQITTEIGGNGAYSNAFTNTSYIGYIAECADFEIERILDLYHQIIVEPLFPEDQYLTERENVRSELTHDLTNYGNKIWMHVNEAAYPKIILKKEDRCDQLDSITHTDVVEHYHKTHSARNANFVLVGAIKENRKVIERGLNRIYDALPTGERNGLWDDKGTGQAQPIIVPESIDSIYFNINWFQDGVEAQRRAAGNVMRSIMAGGFSSRIYGKAREAGLTYSLGAGTDWMLKGAEFNVAGFCNPDKWESLLKLIATELNDVATNGPTDDEVEAAKRRIIGGIKLNSQTAADVAGWYAGDYLFDGTTLSYQEYFNFVTAVTPAMIRDITQYFIQSPDHAIGVLGNPAVLKEEAIDRIVKPVWR